VKVSSQPRYQVDSIKPVGSCAIFALVSRGAHALNFQFGTHGKRLSIDPKEESRSMTKAQLVARVAAKTGLNKRESAAVVTWLLRCIVEALQAGDKVELVRHEAA
jgi:hypothetical protein